MRSLNHEGELLAIRVTPVNVDDRKGLLAIVSALCGKKYDDKGCIGKEFAPKMRDKGIEIMTRVRKNMKEACTLTLTALCYASAHWSRRSSMNSRICARSGTPGIAR
jgi:hypothetical protein